MTQTDLANLPTLNEVCEAWRKSLVPYVVDHGAEAVAEHLGVKPAAVFANLRKAGVNGHELDTRVKRERRDFRRQVVAYARQHGIKAAAYDFNVCRTSIWEWSRRPDLTDGSVQ